MGAPSKWALTTPVMALACATPLLTTHTPTWRLNRPQDSAMYAAACSLRVSISRIPARRQPAYTWFNPCPHRVLIHSTP